MGGLLKLKYTLINMKVLIVEDEASIADRIVRLLRELLGTSLESTTIHDNVASANEYIHTKPVDLVILDLNLHGKSGFEILKEAGAESFHTIIISAYKEKAIEAFEYGVLDFVPKPFTKERFSKALSRMNSTEDKLSVKTKLLVVKLAHSVVPVKCADIVFVKAEGNYSRLFLESGAKLLHEKSLNKLEVLLPSSFMRIHKSYIINTVFLLKYRVFKGSRYEVELKGDHTLPVGRTRYKNLKELISNINKNGIKKPEEP
jgi:two-component system, LytTR family, response regulator LytT